MSTTDWPLTVDCPTCGGRGRVKRSRTIDTDDGPLTGFARLDPCHTCAGTGTVSGIPLLLAKLDAFTETYPYDSEDPGYNMAVGAAAALRYALTGEIDATLDNLLANVDEATESTEAQ